MLKGGGYRFVSRFVSRLCKVTSDYLTWKLYLMQSLPEVG